VKEFLTSPHLATSSGDISRYHIDLEPGHTILAERAPCTRTTTIPWVIAWFSSRTLLLRCLTHSQCPVQPSVCRTKPSPPSLPTSLPS
jgi:hypothetical protein